MTRPAPFLFNTDFRKDCRAKGPTDADMGELRARSHAEGHAEGYAAAKTEMDAQLIVLATQLQAQADALVLAEEERALRQEEAAAQLAVTLARRISGAALAQKPLAEIEAAARACIIHARSAPHLAIRVAESMVAEVDRLFARITREIGYAGKVVVLAEPDMTPAEARMEWADGGLVIDPAAREAAIDMAVSRVLGTASLHSTDAEVHQ